MNSAGVSLTPAERALLPQLLSLLRSGELRALLPAEPTAPRAAKPPVDRPPRAASGKPGGQDKTLQPGSGSSQEQDGWTTVKRRKPEKPPEAQSESLVADGWYVPVRASIDDLKLDSPGVFLGSSAAVRRALREFAGQADVALAILGPADVEEKGRLLQIQVVSADGKIQSRARYIFQLGQPAVEYAPGAPRRAVLCDTGRIVLNLKNNYTDKTAWEFAQAKGGAAARAWLRKSGVESLDTRPPTRPQGLTDELQVVATIPAKSVEEALKASGINGVFVRPFYDRGTQPDYRTVPLPEGTTLEGARRQTQFLGEISVGVALTTRGLGIRVKHADFERAARLLRPSDADHFIGEKWEVAGLPVCTGREALMGFLHDWEFHPLYTFRRGWGRVWVVRSSANPPAG